MTDPIILTINYGFLYFLIFLASIFIVSKFSRKMTSGEKDDYNIIKKIGYVIVPVIAGIMISILAVNNAFETHPVENGDISNWTTLIIEIGIGVIIGLTIFIYSDREQKKTKYLLDEQVNRSKRRNEFVIKEIRYKISFASDVSTSSTELRECFSIENVDEMVAKIDDLTHNLPYVIDELKIVQNLIGLYADDIEPDDLKLFLRVAKNAQSLSKFIDEEPDYLANTLENFENDLKVFFEKFPAINWNANQDEALG